MTDRRIDAFFPLRDAEILRAGGVTPISPRRASVDAVLRRLAYPVADMALALNQC